METSNWYLELIKPSWAPPSWIFGPVWTVLYTIIFISFGFVLYKTLKKEIPWIVTIPFVLNIIFNFLFTPLQFGLKNNVLAFIDIVFVWGTLLWLLIAIWKFSKDLRWVALVNIPYFLWVSFATVLQGTVTYLNY